MKEANQNNSDYSFIEEKIKERPINKRKLVRKSILTMGAAILFGLVACITFICLEPLVSKMISPDTETPLEQIVITESEEPYEELPEVVIDEIPIEDLMIEDEPGYANGEEGGEAGNPQEPAGVENNPTTIIETLPLEISDYQLLYRKMYALSLEVQKSLVSVTGISSDTDWMNSSFQSSTQTVGVIIGDNKKDLLILADNRKIKNADSIRVTFVDGTEREALLKKTDKETGLTIYGVSLGTIPLETKSAYKKVSIGSSRAISTVGSPVIALGSPTGISNSICYGAVTSNSMVVSVLDANYQMITTDIFGNQDANGVIVNMSGQMIGFICQDHNSDDMKNLIYAYGISSIRKLIENLSNDIDYPYLGLYLNDVTPQAVSFYHIPQGAYITHVDLNSPAMNVGISPSDVLVAVGGRPIEKVSDYMEALAEHAPDEMVQLSLMRYSGDGYKEYHVEAQLGRK